MSEIDQLLMEQVDMSHDPFDDVVEIEPTETDEDESEEAEAQEPEAEEEGQEAESEDGIEDLSEEKSDDEAGDEPDGEQPEEETLDLSKAIEEGSLEIKLSEEESVTLQDLKNSHVGQKEIAQRFTEYDVKSKQLEKDTEEINGYINTFAEHLKNGDSVGAMQFFGEFAGIAPYMIKEQLIAALSPEIQRRHTLSPTEVQNEYLNNQNEYLVGQRKSEDERRVYEETQQGLDNSINELREADDISTKDWQDTQAHLEQTLEAGDELTPELVRDTILFGRLYEQAESVVNASTEQMDNADEWVEELVNVKEQYPDFTDEDLAAVLKDALSTHNEQRVQTKLANKVIKRSPQTKTKTITEPELDPELEDWL